MSGRRFAVALVPLLGLLGASCTDVPTGVQDQPHLVSFSDGFCTLTNHLFSQDPPGTEESTSREATYYECLAILGAINEMSLSNDPRCNGIQYDLLGFYYQGRISVWNWIGSHYDDLGVTMQVHEDDMESLDNLIIALTHEILHYQGYDHPDNFEMEEICLPPN